MVTLQIQGKMIWAFAMLGFKATAGRQWLVRTKKLQTSCATWSGIHHGCLGQLVRIELLNLFFSSSMGNVIDNRQYNKQLKSMAKKWHLYKHQNTL